MFEALIQDDLEYLTEFLNKCAVRKGMFPSNYLTDLEIKVLEFDTGGHLMIKTKNQLKFLITMIIVYRGIILGFLLNSKITDKFKVLNNKARRYLTALF